VISTGQALRQAREEAGIGLQEMAKALDPEKPTSSTLSRLSRIENGWLPLEDGLPERYGAVILQLTQERADNAKRHFAKPRRARRSA
jgi:hypothetical protein